ncbi:MAG TPA: hypothetical protein VFM90_03885, partial [Cyclobacteriaceae bacterium]|nr:hypothetical protein [Cyclobacteriaceae bacterium]
NGGAMLKVNLVKTVYDSIATTRIDSAGYILEWVYRTADAKRDYYVLPVPAFEHDTTAFIKDEASRLAFKTFIDDSRKLFNKHNVRVKEIRHQPSAPGEAIKPEEE